MLAIMRISGAYVPLDPAFPIDRLEHMANDAALSAVIVRHATVIPKVFQIASEPVGALAGRMWIGSDSTFLITPGVRPSGPRASLS